MQGPYKITKEQQLKELNSRIPPIINVDIIIKKDNFYLLGHHKDKLLFPGGRMKYTETPQETAFRILKEEVPGVQATIKKILTVEADKGWDKRAYGVTIYFLLDYISGEPIPNDRILDLQWIPAKEFAQSDNIYSIEQNLASQIDIASKTLHISEDELLVEVDKDNKKIGTLTRKDAHSDPKRFHRAAHIMIFTTTGDIVLQQRSWNKSTGPGMWDMPGGHQAEGQTIDQCAMQELAEEVGISTELTLKRIGLYQSNSQSEYYYLYYGISDGPYGFDKNEVEQVAVYKCEDLLKEKRKDVFPHVLQYIEELKNIWEPLKKDE